MSVQTFFPQHMTANEISDLICIYYAKMNASDHPEYRNYSEDFRLLSDVYGRKYKGYTNQKDIFDAFFENGRKGWHQRELSKQGPHFAKSYELYKTVSLDEMRPLVNEIRKYLLSIKSTQNTNEKLDISIKQFVNSRLVDLIQHEKNMEPTRKKFIKQFPIDRFGEMKLEDYAIGTKGENQNWDETFCYSIETKLKPLGSILGSTSSKFGVYWDSSNHKYKFVKRYFSRISDSENFNLIKQDISNLLENGSNRSFKDINSNSLSPMFKSKLLVTYYPQLYLNIFNENDVDNILINLGIPFSIDLSLEEKKHILLKFKENDKRMIDWTNYVYSCFLYELFRKPTAEISINDKQITLMQYSIIGPHKKNSSIGNHDIDYKDAYDSKVFIGLSGEKIVESYEKNRLKGEKSPFWRKVKIISTENPRAGYDVQSYLKNGEPLNIEVKSTSKSSTKVMDFYLTDNEYKKFVVDPNHVIYYLSNVKGNNVKLFIITREDFKRVDPQPVLYKITLDIDSREV